SGVYRAEFEDAHGLVTVLCFCVSVWEPVRQPHLETLILHQEQGSCNVSLDCTLPGASNVSYSWSCSGDALGALEHQPRLHLWVHADADPTICSCNVSNPVSWSTASTNVVAPCRAAVSGLFSTFVGWLVAALIVAAIFVAFIVIYCRWRKRGRDALGGLSPGHGDQSLTVYEEVGRARPSQDSNGTGTQPPSGARKLHHLRHGPDHQEGSPSAPQSPSLRRKRLDRALISTAYAEVMGTGP
ncbi:PREDICTED: natural killer cell receptor 2B4-like, partial [Tauraco erythrolophus]|uniref:natural killer cell receptor 2B4-like n=1 Tax=Tauraco erythrolophus TaxID=121530 RepID=UPI000523E9CC